MNNGKNNSMRNKRRIVALALAGVLAIGGVGVVCAAGFSKSPGQAPAAAQTVAAKPAVKATTAKATTKKAESGKTATKPVVKRAAAAKQSASAPAVIKAEAPKQAAVMQPTQVAQSAAPQVAPSQTTPQAEIPEVQEPAAASINSGLEAKFSCGQCINIALVHVGAGGQAKGEANNVTARQVTGGGTVYYVVELDLGDVHYTVNVDAIDGNVIGADSTHAGTRTLLDEQGVEIEGTETAAE